MTVDLAVVPVAGRGTRLLPLTKSMPKEMLPVGRKPIVQYVAEELAGAGIRRMAFVTGPGKTAIENHFDLDDALITALRESGQEDLLERLEFERMDLEYFYTRQRRQLGLGHAVLCAAPVIGTQPFVVALGDSIIGLAAKSRVVRQMIDVFESEKADAVIALESVPEGEVHRYGIAVPAQRGGRYFPLKAVVEKPEPSAVPSNLAVAARYVFRPRILDLLRVTRPGVGGEIQLTDAIGAMIDEGGKVLGIELPEQESRYDIGNFASYFRAFLDFALADEQYGPELAEFARRRLEGRGGGSNGVVE